MERFRKVSGEYADYLRDESRVAGYADTISFPSDERELLEDVLRCVEGRVPINIQGARTGLSGGASPQGGHILNLGRMNRMLGLRYDAAEDRYLLRVQPGVLLSEVRKALLTKAFDVASWDDASKEALLCMRPGEWIFGPDPTEPTASIGGMAACNASGSRSVYYGPVREHVEALRAVLSNGRVTALSRGMRADGMRFELPLEGGGTFSGILPDYTPPATKDAGYWIRPDMDLLDLFIGSMGTLGVISELTIRLCRAPAAIFGLTAFFPNDYASIDYVRVLRGEKLDDKPTFPWKPTVLEFFDQRALDMVVRFKAVTPSFSQIQDLPEGYESAVYVEFNLDEAAKIFPMLERLSEVIVSLGGDPDNTWVADRPQKLDKLIFFRHTVPECVNLVVAENQKKDPVITILSADMAVPDWRIVDVYEMYRRDMIENGVEWILFGHIGETHYHPNLFAKDRDEYERSLRLFEKWAAKVREWGGSITAEHGVGKLKKNLARILYGPENLKKLRAFKRSMDPFGLLSPGNIID